MKPPSSAVKGLSEPSNFSSQPASQPEGSGIRLPSYCRATTVTARAASLLLIWVFRLTLKRPGPERLNRANQILVRNTC